MTASITETARAYHNRMFPGRPSTLRDSDPDFAEIFENFAFDEVPNHDDMDDRTRFTVVLASLVGCQGIDAFRAFVPAALEFGMTPVEIKEIVYQSTAYLGIGRVLPFLHAMNEVFIESNVTLPLESQTRVSREERREAGTQVQVELFGEGMHDFWKSGPVESRHINEWLAANCFGDYYTRGGLDLAQRELITFCFLAAQGGCEPQLVSHAAANMRVGNDKEFLIKVVSQCIPYLGYPRCLNALRCVEEAAAQL